MSSLAKLDDYSGYVDQIQAGTLPSGLSQGEWDDWGRIVSFTTKRNVTTIEDKAFYAYKSLTSSSMPNVTSIGSQAFQSCSSLASVSMPSVTSIGQQAFYGCTSLVLTSLPTYLTSIAQNAFSGCTGLTTITVSDNTQDIMDNAFNGCSSLQSFYISATTPPTLGTGVFDNCHSSFTIYVPDNLVETYKTSWSAYADKIQSNVPRKAKLIFNENDTEIVEYIPDDGTNVLTQSEVTSIGRSLTTLYQVDVSPSVTSIGDDAFKGGSTTNYCGLQIINMPNVTSVGNEAFYYNLTLNTVYFPQLTTVGISSFYQCTGLSQLDLSNVTSIGIGAFHTTNLTSVSLPSVISIDSSAFSTCSQLTSVSLPSVITINSRAFEKCTSLKTIDIGVNITSIGGSQFDGCTNLTTITVMATTPPTLGKRAFRNCNALAHIYVPAESVEAYKTATNWSTYADKIQAIQS